MHSVAIHELNLHIFIVPSIALLQVYSDKLLMSLSSVHLRSMNIETGYNCMHNSRPEGGGGGLQVSEVDQEAILPLQLQV